MQDILAGLLPASASSHSSRMVTTSGRSLLTASARAGPGTGPPAPDWSPGVQAQPETAAVTALAVGLELQVAEIPEQGHSLSMRLAVDHHADPDVVVHEHQHRIGTRFLYSRSAWIGCAPSPLTSTGTEGLLGWAEGPVACVVVGSA